MGSEAAHFLEVGMEYALVVRLCEHLRTTEPYPQSEWRAAWAKRQRLLTELMRAAEKLAPLQEPTSDE